MTETRRVRFTGRIAGIGSTSGIRVVVGRWDAGPLGAFADCMVALGSGHRILLAPSADVVRFVAATYDFDEIRLEPVTVHRGATGWRVRTPSLRLDLSLGATTALGRLLALVPRPVAETPAWCAVTDPVARLALRGVRTRGTTGSDRLGTIRGQAGRRREWYGATGHRAVTAITGHFDGTDLGRLAPVTPPPGFGFGSTPPRPSVTDLVTTVELGADVPLVGG